MIESVFITDRAGKLVFQYLQLPASQSFLSLAGIIGQNHTSEPIGNLESSILELNSDYNCCSKWNSSTCIRLICCKRPVYNPVIPFELLDRMFEAFESYLGSPLTSTKIEASTDLVTVITNEMIESTIPVQTDINMLQTVASLESLFSKILSIGSSLANAAMPSKPTRGPIKSVNSAPESPANEATIPWRRPNVRHTNNLMYVDVEEKINVILKAVPRKGRKLASLAKRFDSAFYSATQLETLNISLVPVSGTISGLVHFNSQLSGIPQIQLFLRGARGLVDLPQFHRCIKLDTWASSPGTLSFIPPDGRSTLMDYTIDLGDHPVNLGFINVDFQQGLGTFEDEFEIKLYCHEVKAVENLTVEVVRDGVENGGFSSHRITHGNFSTKNDNTGVWNIRKLNAGVPCIFRGSVGKRNPEEDPEGTKSEKPPTFPLYLKLSYTAKGAVPSGLKVESLKIVSAKGLSDSVKPYKGVKYITSTGDYIIRTHR